MRIEPERAERAERRLRSTSPAKLQPGSPNMGKLAQTDVAVTQPRAGKAQNLATSRTAKPVSPLSASHSSMTGASNRTALVHPNDAAKELMQFLSTHAAQQGHDLSYVLFLKDSTGSGMMSLSFFLGVLLELQAPKHCMQLLRTALLNSSTG